MILERGGELGGILGQCIHNGFGLHKFKEELTGPEYAWRYEEQIEMLKIPYMLNTMVTGITKDKKITAVNSAEGIFEIQTKAIILAMGCRERSKGALNIPGSRPVGVYSAGTVQKYVNLKGYLPGREVVILGSGDIGLIMARRMTLEGAKVRAVCEIMPYSSGLARNVQQCLNDFGIPLKLSHTVVEIHGKSRLTGVTIAKVDENLKPVMDTKEYIPCDTLLSVGLIPENDLSKDIGIEFDSVTGGLLLTRTAKRLFPYFCLRKCFACTRPCGLCFGRSGNRRQGRRRLYKSKAGTAINIPIKTDGKIRYTVPQRFTECNKTVLYFRTAGVYNNAVVNVRDGDKIICSKKKRKLLPAEMETITLTEEMICSVNSGCLSVELEVAEND